MSRGVVTFFLIIACFGLTLSMFASDETGDKLVDANNRVIQWNEETYNMFFYDYDYNEKLNTYDITMTLNEEPFRSAEDVSAALDDFMGKAAVITADRIHKEIGKYFKKMGTAVTVRVYYKEGTLYYTKQ